MSSYKTEEVVKQQSILQNEIKKINDLFYDIIDDSQDSFFSVGTYKDVPLSSVKICFDDKEDTIKYVSFYDEVRTEEYDNPETVKNVILRKVKAFLSYHTVSDDEFCEHLLFWRIKPEIECFFNFDYSTTVCRGIYRLFLVKKHGG